MSGNVQEMYQRYNSSDYGYLSQDVKNWLYNSVPDIVDIHFTAPSAYASNDDHITIVFEDNSRLHWYYNTTDHFIIPKKSNSYNSMAKNYIRYNKQDLNWLEDELYEVMDNNTEFFDKPTPTYGRPNYIYNQYGTNFGGKKFTRKSYKRKSYKRKSYKRKSYKRKSYKRKSYKRKSYKRKSYKRKSYKRK